MYPVLVVDTAPRAEEVLARRVRAYRQSKGWSQDDLAREMNELGFQWTQSIATRTESATRPIRVDEAAALATLFGVGIEYLIREEEQPLDALYERTLLLRPPLLRRLDSTQRDAKEIETELAAIDAKLKAIAALRNAMEQRDGAREALSGFVDVFGKRETEAVLVQSGVVQDIAKLDFE